MNIFMIVYMNKYTKKDGFMIWKGRCWDDIYARFREKFKDRLIVLGHSKCCPINDNVNEEMVLMYESK